jgi:APA family basic amino acid/polyamine antiporter
MPELSPSTRDLPRALGALPALGVMIGIIIGSGIFKTPSEIAGATQSPLVVLLCWLAGGVISLFGAFTYAELATMFPQSGGVYVFLREGYGRGMAFVFGWTYMLVSKPAAAAGIAVIFTENLHPLLGITWDARYTTIALIVALTLINARGVSLGAGRRHGPHRAQGPRARRDRRARPRAPQGLRRTTSTPRTLAPAAPPRPRRHHERRALDLRRMERRRRHRRRDQAARPQAPAHLHGRERSFITGLYLAVNAVYIWMMPISEMATPGQRRAGDPHHARRVRGRHRASCSSSSSPRSAPPSARSSPAPASPTPNHATACSLRFCRVSTRASARPNVALWCQCVLSCAAVWFLESFGRMAGSFVFTMWIFYGLGGRDDLHHARQAPRPAAGLPLLRLSRSCPLLFVASSAMMTVLSIMADWKTCVTWVGVLLAGIPVYLVWSRMAGKETGETKRQ